VSVLHSSLSSPRLPLFLVFAVVATVTVGAVTSTVLIAPLIVFCVLGTGLFALHGTDLSPIERLVLIPAVGTALLAVSSLLIPLLSTLGLVQSPVSSSVVVATAVALPTVLAIGYWARTGDPTVPSVDGSPRLLVPLLPAVLGGGGALIQRQFGVVTQNYLVVALLLVAGPALLYWAETEFEVALSLYGLAVGILLSHTLVTAYVVGIDNQWSLHTVEQIGATGTWSLNDIFFVPGAAEEPLSGLIDYIGTELKHTLLPVIVGVPLLFEAVGNVPPDAVLDILFVGLFALVPVGVYRLGREHLSVRDAFVGGMVAVAYYRFFHVSPGKQHMAQFFVAALLVTWHTRLAGPRRKAAAILLTIGIVFSHYAVTFLFLGFILASYASAKWFVSAAEPSDLSLPYVGYFYTATALWYIVITGGQKPLQAISAITLSVERVLLEGTTQERTAVGVVESRTLLVDQLNILLHALLLATIGLGAVAVLVHALRTRKPLFSSVLDTLAVWYLAFVGVSVVATGHLGIDRALDISLVVLAPVGVLGLRRVLKLAGRFSGLDLAPSTHRVGLAFVVLLFAFSSGFAYAAAGQTATSAINLQEEPNSVVFTDAEYEAGKWVTANRNDSTVYYNSFTSVTFHRLNGAVPGYAVPIKDYANEVQIDWESGGYIFLRKAAITSDEFVTVPRQTIQRRQYESFLERSEVAFENRDVVVLRIIPGEGGIPS